MNRRNKRKRIAIERTGASGQRFGTPVDSVTVGSWCPTPDGSGPAEAVAMQLRVKGMSFIMRLRSPEAVDALIEALQEHKRDVWPHDAGQ